MSNTASSGAEAKRRKIEHNSINGINFREEFDLLAELQPHLNIIQFLKVIEDSNHPDSVFLVMEVAEAGVVMDVAPHSVIQPYKETECRNIFRQLVAAVNHCKYFNGFSIDKMCGD